MAPLERSSGDSDSPATDTRRPGRWPSSPSLENLGRSSSVRFGLGLAAPAFRAVSTARAAARCGGRGVWFFFFFSRAAVSHHVAASAARVPEALRKGSRKNVRRRARRRRHPYRSRRSGRRSAARRRRPQRRRRPSRRGTFCATKDQRAPLSAEGKGQGGRRRRTCTSMACACACSFLFPCCRSCEHVSHSARAPGSMSSGPRGAHAPGSARSPRGVAALDAAGAHQRAPRTVGRGSAHVSSVAKLKQIVPREGFGRCEARAAAAGQWSPCGGCGAWSLVSTVHRAAATGRGQWSPCARLPRGVVSGHHAAGAGRGQWYRLLAHWTHTAGARGPRDLARGAAGLDPTAEPRAARLLMPAIMCV